MSSRRDVFERRLDLSTRDPPMLREEQAPGDTTDDGPTIVATNFPRVVHQSSSRSEPAGHQPVMDPHCS
jgi:hypothetical protein